MSTAGSTLLACNDVQLELTSIFETCGHEFNYRDSAFMDFITSPSNKSGIDFVINPGGSKTRTVVARYDQKIPTSEVTEVDECELDCTATTQRGDLSETISMDICEKLKVEETWNIYDLAPICRDNPSFIFKRINHLMAALEAKVAEKTAEEAILLNGKWATDVATTGDVLRVATLLSGGINLNPTFLSKIRMALKKTAYCTAPGIFGSSLLYEAADNLNVGCCTDSGWDIQAIAARYGQAIMWDPYITDAFNSDSMSLVVGLGALQLLNYSVGSEANFTSIQTMGSNFELIPVVTPRYGIKADLVVSNNCGQLSLILTTSTKLIGAPLDMFPASDVLEGVNYVNLLEVANP